MEWIDTAKAIRFSPERVQKVDLFRTQRFMIDLYCLQSGQAQKPHVHEGIDKVYYVVEGEGLFTIGVEERTLGKGEAVLAPAGVEHGLSNPGSTPLVVLVFIAPPPEGQ